MGRREVTTNAIEGQLATAVTLLSAMREHSRREQRTTGLFVAEAKEIRTVGLFLVAGVGSEASRLSAPPRYDTAHCGPQRFGEPACLRIRVVRDDWHRQRFQERHGRGLIGVGQSRELRLRTGRLAPVRDNCRENRIEVSAMPVGRRISNVPEFRGEELVARDCGGTVVG